jgi:hypothetical protein
MSYDPLKFMSDADLLRGLRKIGEPLLAELVLRGYQVELDTKDASFGVVRFATVPAIAPTLGKAAAGLD